MIESNEYYNNLTRNYGVHATGGDFSNAFKGNTKFEEIEVGMEFIDVETKQIARVTSLTSNSIEMLNQKNLNSRYSNTKRVDADGEVQDKGKCKGIDSKNWYTIELFNRLYKKK